MGPPIVAKQCANCNTYKNELFQDFYNKQVKDDDTPVMDQRDTHTKIKVWDALFSIYLKLYDKNEDEECEKNIGLCVECCDILRQLYFYFSEFFKLQTIDSYLAKIVDLERTIKLLQDSTVSKESVPNVISCNDRPGPWVKLKRLRPEEILLVTDKSLKHEEGFEEDDIDLSFSLDNSDSDDEWTGFRKRRRLKKSKSVKVPSHKSRDCVPEQSDEEIDVPPNSVESLFSPESPHETLEVPLNIFECPNCLKNFPSENILEVHRDTCPSLRKRKQKTSDPSPTSTSSEENSDEDFPSSESDPDEEEKYNNIQSSSSFPPSRNRRYPCPYTECSFAIRTKKGVKTHLLDTHGHEETDPSDRFPCTQCDQKYAYKYQLKDHTLRQHGQRTKMCTRCPMTFFTDHDLLRHERTHDPSGPPRRHQCLFEDCGKFFSSPSHLKRHSQIHSDQRLVEFTQRVCKTCGQSFKSWDKLVRHQEIHEPHPFKCPHEKCFRKFTSEEKLRIHSAKCKMCVCPECGKIFGKKSYLQDHMVCHTKEKKYKCERDDCGRTFLRRSELIQHERSAHTDDRPFTCLEEGCSSKFRTAKGLREHRHVHDPTKSCLCAECGKAFKTMRNLREHMEIHKNTEASHICEHCSRAFRTPRLLREHLLTHTEVKSHLCCLCGKGFRQKKNLTKHEMTQCGLVKILNYKCENCDSAFSDRRGLKKHQKVHEAVM